jgi:hypothetical protein
MLVVDASAVAELLLMALPSPSSSVEADNQAAVMAATSEATAQVRA